MSVAQGGHESQDVGFGLLWSQSDTSVMSSETEPTHTVYLCPDEEVEPEESNPFSFREFLRCKNQDQDQDQEQTHSEVHGLQSLQEEKKNWCDAQ